MQIKKLSYSRSPWRLLNSQGQQIVAPRAFAHGSIGLTVIDEPICGNTRAECERAALALLESLINTLNS